MAARTSCMSGGGQERDQDRGEKVWSSLGVVLAFHMGSGSAGSITVGVKALTPLMAGAG
jgi:hypothetical protein